MSSGSDLAQQTKKHISVKFYYELKIVISNFLCTILEVQDLKTENMKKKVWRQKILAFFVSKCFSLQHPLELVLIIHFGFFLWHRQRIHSFFAYLGLLVFLLLAKNYFKLPDALLLKIHHFRPPSTSVWRIQLKSDQ